MLENVQPTKRVMRRLPLAPVIGRSIPGGLQHLGEPFGSKHSLDGAVIIEKEMLRHQDHRQRIDRPAARQVIDLNIDLGLSHPAYLPQTSFSNVTQLPPITRSMRSVGQLRRSIAAVRFGHSPIVRNPSGLITSPKSVSRRA